MAEELQLPNPADQGHLWLHQAQQKPNRIRMHRHEELEFNLCTKGRATYLVDEQRYDLQVGTLLWLFPDEEHVLLDSSADFEMWIMVIRPAWLEQHCTTKASRRLTQRRAHGPICSLLGESARVYLVRLFVDILPVQSQDFALWNSGMIYAMLAAWRAHHQADAADAADVHPAVERAAVLIRNHESDASVADLAASSGLSASRLSRLFKQQTGVSIVDYRNRQRIDRFLEIYQHGRRRNLTDAALAAGFGSYPQFHRVFTRIMGYGPAEHRRRMSRSL